MKKLILAAVITAAAIPAQADYTIGIMNVTDLGRQIGYFLDMQECKDANNELLSSNGFSTFGTTIRTESDNPEIVGTMHTWFEEDGLICVDIPSNYGFE